MKRRSWDLRLAVVAVAAWSGVLLGLQTGAVLQKASGLALAASVVGVLLITVFSPPGSKGLSTGLLLLVCFVALAVGALIGGTQKASFQEDPLVIAARGGRFVKVEGVIQTHAVEQTMLWQHGKLRVVVAARVLLDLKDGQAAQGSAGLPCSSQFTLEFDSQQARRTDIVPGARLLVSGLISQDDWQRAPLAGTLKATNMVLIEEAPAWQLWASGLRTNLARETDRVAGPVVGPLVSGMAIGDDQRLGRVERQAMLTTSLTHLTAVSGSHIAISVALLRALTPRARKLRNVLTVVFLGLIVLVVGPAPSVMRAVSMSLLVVWGLVRKRPGQPLAVLSAVVLGAVLLFPWLAISIGFSLSVVATAGIILMARALEEFMVRALPDEGVLRELAKPVLTAVAVAVSAQASTLPILALFNDWLPTWGVVANLLVAPVVPVMTIFGVAATVFLWLPPVTEFLVTLVRPAGDWMAWISSTIASWPLARFPWIQGWPGAVLVILATLAAVGVLPLAWLIADLFRNAHRRRSAAGLLVVSTAPDTRESASTRTVLEEKTIRFD